MTHHTSNYEALMREQGYRVTPQRQLILDAICFGGGHTTVEEIYQRVHATAPAVNPATIYRTVTWLRELRLVTETRIGDKTYYEIAGETPHHHLVCRVCGKVEQMSHDTVRGLFATIEREQQFTVETNHLALVGVCQQCHTAQRQA